MADEDRAQPPSNASATDVGIPKTSDTNGGQNEISDIKQKPKTKKSVKSEEFGVDEVLQGSKSPGDDEASNATPKSAKVLKTPKIPKAPKGKGKVNDSKIDPPTRRTPKKRTPKNAVKADDETDLTYGSDKITTPRKKRVPTDVPNNDNGEPSTPPSKKRRAPTVTPTTGRIIPESRDDLDEKDKMLLEMKEQGKSWPEIREAFKRIGITTGSSTLPNRYSRLTAKLVEWKAGDVDIFLAAKSTIETENLEAKKAMEAKFEAEKWGKISAAMEENGADRYTSAALQKKFKVITAKDSSGASGSNGGPSNTSDPAGPVKAVGGTLPTEATLDQKCQESDGNEDM